MRLLLTGATGWIGSALVPDLLEAGHEVVGLARSDASADALATAGAEVRRGTLDDVAALRDAAGATDGVIHLAFKHEEAFAGNPASANEADRRAVEAFGDALAGSDRPLVIASGLAGLQPGRVATEADQPDPRLPGGERALAARTALAYADRAVRTVCVRFPPTVHADGDHGFVPRLVDVARQQGTSAFIGRGANHWPAVHRFDAARLLRLAVEEAPAGSVLHGIAEQGVETRAIAEAIGRGLDLPVESLSPDAAAAHFGWLAGLFGLDVLASSEHTRDLLGWQPTHPGLIEDLDQGHYFSTTPTTHRQTDPV